VTEFHEWRDAPEAHFAVIGDPVSHSLSPAMHNAALKELRLPFKYVALRVPAGEVGKALDHLQALGFIGVNVTVPHKEEALNWCTVRDAFSTKVKAANTVRVAARSCINTDAPGFLQTLEGMTFQERSALVLGAGGSARALATALVDTGWRVRIFNRTAQRAEELAEQAGAQFSETPDPAGAGLILNTTSASLGGQSIAIDWTRASRGSLAYDLMYTDGLTPFLAEAERAGLAVVDGIPLLVSQGVLSLSYWLGFPVPADAMLCGIQEKRLRDRELATAAKVKLPDEAAIVEAAAILRDGGLVGLPTETVYGIAADSTNEAAIRSIFSLKGRPADNPLIFHVADLEMLNSVAVFDKAEVSRIAEDFWPGPLTLVLEKKPEVSRLATAGLGTVACRIPAHPVARKVIEALGRPVAAPSANRFMAVSPTRAEHISPSIAAGLGLIIDGGPCSVGLESTVLDLTRPPYAILRPGGVSRARLEALLGPLGEGGQKERRSPGLYARHYAPRTPVEVVQTLSPKEGGITLEAPRNEWQIRLPRDPVLFGAGLYSALMQLDGSGLALICVQAPPTTPEWEAVWDRLSRASSE